MFALIAAALTVAGLAAPSARAWLGTGVTVTPNGWQPVTNGNLTALVVAEAYWAGSGGFIFNDDDQGDDMDLALRTNCTGIGYNAIEYLCNSTSQGDDISHVCPSGSSIVATQGNLQGVNSFNWGTDPCDFQ